MKIMRVTIKNTFTLIELLVAMAVFSVLMYVLMDFFNQAQQAWTNCARRTEVYENARLALDLIERDLQCVYYVDEVTPFWHKGAVDFDGTAYDIYNNEALAFISNTPVPPNDECNSRLCEVIYQLYRNEGASADPTLEGWLMRSVTGDIKIGGASNAYSATNTSGKWGLFLTDPWPATFDSASATGDANLIFTLKDGSSNAFEKVIPYVTSLTFTCSDDLNAPLDRDPDTSTDATSSEYTDFPYIVEVKLKILDKASWLKWKAQGGTPNNLTTDPAKTFREANERTFSRNILIGDRGQPYNH